MKTVAPGFTILKKYGRLKNACWILENNGEAAIVEMPPFTRDEKPPYKKARAYFKKNRLFPRYGLITHPHWDHCQTLPQFRNEFPQAHFVAHQSFLEDPFIRYILGNTRTARGNDWLMGGYRFFDQVFFEDFIQLSLGGEPLYLIHAPKHSYGDVLIIFRGGMITGDWFMGDLTDCNDLVNPQDKIQSINRVMDILRYLNYHVHMLFSGHGDCLFYDADVFSILEQSKSYHNGGQPDMKARFERG